MTDTLGYNAAQVLGAKEAGGFLDFDLTETPELRRRRLREGRFKLYGIVAILISLSVLALLVASTFLRALPVLSETQIGLDITYDEALIDPLGERDPDALRFASYRPVIANALSEQVPQEGDRATKRDLLRMMSAGAGFRLADRVAENPDIIGTTQREWLPASSEINLYLTGRIDPATPEEFRQLSDRQLYWVDELGKMDRVRRTFNRTFFQNGDSREPELAGMVGALLGSIFVVLVCFAISFPLGVATATYLEEFAPKNKFTDFIEVNINNLAAVPSIVYGLLGLFMFLTVFDLPRSTPLVGGMVLALMALPIIIIASRASLRSVPPSVRAAALGLGASKVQTTFHHVVPLAMPGMLTGTIIAMARALGETAPLLMIGMVAFIVDLPKGVTDAATTLPVQIFLWFDSPERAFQERASATIIVLLVVLVLMNLLAVLLRRKLERRW